MSYIGEELLWVVALFLITLAGVELMARFFGSTKK